MKRALLLLALLCSCGPNGAAVPTPTACGNPCSLNSDCSQFFNGCRVCFNGRCASSLPAAPVADGGTDATPTATRGETARKTDP